MLASDLVVYLGGYTFLVFLALCLATGLYYLAELVEEYASVTKKVITHCIQGVLGIHVLLLIFDEMPVSCLVTGIAAHCMYFTLLKHFPYIALTSPQFFLCCALLVANHVMWLPYFATRHYDVEYIMGFFLITVWLVPFGIFIALAANESVLPLSGGGFGSSTDISNYDDAPSSGQKGRKSRSLVVTLMDCLKRKGDGALPFIKPYLGAQKERLL
ncbi:hypothetical protein CYMTET_9737 [Cymbomonas tetramitiformis]|uniref:Protein TEX261 n=1 Tax=Cymbomonas tetramitiformis TaxID=36881 RepID=A0AAE0LF61_9CHLO|nr:hypothetical protein CYMTET_9737 [Cymbomonas tetramitiformis]